MIVVRRRADWFLRLGRARIYVDGEKVARVRAGQQVSFSGSGEIQVMYVKMSWLTSNSVQIQDAGHIADYYLFVRPLGSAVWAAYLKPHSVLILSDVEPEIA